MSDSFTPTYIGGICKFCHTGEMHQYPQDQTGYLRCGRCGELEIQPTEETPLPHGAVVQVEAKPRTNRRKTN